MLKFKTTPMRHQLAALDALEGKRAFALLMEQGTGKTKVIIDDTARLWGAGSCTGLFVLAPNGVHLKWVTQEIPKHMPEWVPYRAAYFSANGTAAERNQIETLFDVTDQNDVKPLRVLTMNYEAVNTPAGKVLLDRFIECFTVVGVLDESQRVKNYAAKRTQEILKRRRRFRYRRIMTGTPLTRAPFDLFPQYFYLDETILRTSSYVAFKSEYAEMLPDDHYLVRKVQQGDRWKKKDGTPKKRAPQIEARDPNGMPIYRNLDKLNRLIAPHSFRVLKSECLDLPEKIYDTLPFELTPRQRQLYKQIETERRAAIGDLIESIVRAAAKRGISREDAIMEARELIVQNKLVMMAKLQQVTCGYLKLEDGEVVRMFKTPLDNPRNQVLMEAIADAADSGVIIWAPHTDKIEQIIECLRSGYDDAQIVRYDGTVKKNERVEGLDRFVDGTARFFVGNPRAGGTGLTLISEQQQAETVFYYSQDFNAEARWQSEDRNHRIGQTRHVRYYDLAAINTIDERIAMTMQMKKDLADAVIEGES